VAIARALVGFMWAMAKQVPVTPSVYKREGHATPTQEVANGHRQRRSPGVVSASTA
jgi:hypothetical protein